MQKYLLDKMQNKRQSIREKAVHENKTVSKQKFEEPNASKAKVNDFEYEYGNVDEVEYRRNR